MSQLFREMSQPFLLATMLIHFGGRTYPVRYYPIAIRLRDRKGRAILCSHYFLSVGTLRVLHSECVPSHSFTLVFYPREKGRVQRKGILKNGTKVRISHLLISVPLVGGHLIRTSAVAMPQRQ